MKKKAVKSPLHLSVIIPCHNEAQNIKAGALKKVYHYLALQKYSWEVIIANDGSSDNSLALAQKAIAKLPGFKLYNFPHGGKASAQWRGLQKAKGEIILFTDADQSTPISQLAKLLPWYQKGFDAVIGSRRSRPGFNLIRQLGSQVFRGLRRIFLLRQINDTQCGFKSCRRLPALATFAQIEPIRQKQLSPGHKTGAFDVEWLYLLQRKGYRIKEVRVEWSNRDLSNTKSEGSDLSLYLKESKNMLREIIKIIFNQVRGIYSQ